MSEQYAPQEEINEFSDMLRDLRLKYLLESKNTIRTRSTRLLETRKQTIEGINIILRSSINILNAYIIAQDQTVLESKKLSIFEISLIVERKNITNPNLENIIPPTSIKKRDQLFTKIVLDHQANYNHAPIPATNIASKWLSCAFSKNEKSKIRKKNLTLNIGEVKVAELENYYNSRNQFLIDEAFEILKLGFKPYQKTKLYKWLQNIFTKSERGEIAKKLLINRIGLEKYQTLEQLWKNTNHLNSKITTKLKSN